MWRRSRSVPTSRATWVGEDTTLSQIVRMVSDAAATKAPIARIADRVSGVFVPAVIGISVLVLIGWLIHGENLSFSLARAISVLVISCPCALGLATPVAIMVGNGLGAKNGILFKTGEALETAGRVQIIALDKTGTITAGEPKVTDLLPADFCRPPLHWKRRANILLPVPLLPKQNAGTWWRTRSAAFVPCRGTA